MTINYQDKNLIISYIQIYLKEYFGLSLKRVVPRKRSESVKYVITSNESLKVTGYHNTQTYSAIALWMAYNYPREGFPYLWKREVHYDGTGDTVIEWKKDYSFFRDLNKSWKEDDQTSGGYFIQQEDSSGNPVYTIDPSGNKKPQMVTYQELPESSKTKDRQEMIYGYVNPSQLDETVVFNSNNEESRSESKYLATLRDIIAQNIENSAINPSTIEIPERVLSYIFNEVVTESSTSEEILRVKKMIYGSPIDYRKALTYDSQLVEDVIKIQDKFRQRLVDSEGNIQVPLNEDGTPVDNAAIYQEMLENYKITGYVDPWTELAIKEGVELDE